MNFKIVMQLSINLMFFLFSLACAFYEGSEILLHPGDWEYSTYFSKFFNDDTINENNISKLDYFIYAIKFRPLFPLIMFFSGLYLLILLGYHLLRNFIIYSVYLIIIATVLIGLTILMSNSPSNGAKIFTISLILSSISLIISSVIYYVYNSKKSRE